MLLMGIALIWGFAEATLFFIVPDIILGWVILFDRKNTLKVYGVALGGACLGGALMYYWGLNDLQGLKSTLDIIPAINMEMIERTALEMKENALLAMTKASVTGVPYKIAAANAASANLSLGVFLLYSVPARLARWALFGFITGGAYATFLHKMTISTIKIIYLSFWLMFYIVFFYFMGA